MLVIIWTFVLGFASVISAQYNPFIDPSSGDVIPTDEEYTIRWNPGTPGPVSIQLLYDNDKMATNITASTENTGEYKWTPIDRSAGENYFLAICDVITGDCTYTFNGRFSISDSSSTTSSSTSTSATSSKSVTSSSISTTSFSTSTTQIPISQTTTSSAPSETATQDTGPSPPSGLSTGAKIAIGVSLSVSAIAIIAVLLLLRKLRKAQQARDANAGDIGPGSTAEPLGGYHKAELPGEEMGGAKAEREPRNFYVGGGGRDTGEVHELGVNK